MGKTAKLPFWILTIIAIASLILNIYVYALVAGAGNENTPEFLTYTNTVIIGWATVTVVCFALTLKSFSLKSKPGKVWLFFMLGLVTWLIGDIIFMYNQVIVPLPEELQFPSMADQFWTIGYLLIFIGIILQMRLATVKLTRKEIEVVLIVATITSVLALVFIILPVSELLIADPTTTMEYAFFSLDYPILDLVLLPLAIVLALKYRGGEFSKSWAIIGLGFLVTAIFDLLFTYFENFGEGYLFLYTDHLYIGYYMILAIGAMYLHSSLQSLK